MTTRLSPWQHATLAAVLAVITPMVLYLLLFVPAMDSRETFSARLTVLQRQAREFDAILRQHEQFDERVGELETRSRALEGLLSDQPYMLAATESQAYLNALVREQGGELLSIHALHKPATAELDGVIVKLQMRCDTGALQRILYELSYGRLALRLDVVNIQQRGRRSTLQRAQQLDIRIDLTGYVNQAIAL